MNWAVRSNSAMAAGSGVHLNGHFAEFAHPQHSMSPDQLRHTKKFLEDAGIDPEKDYPLHDVPE